MLCPKCNEEYSDPVYPHHVLRCGTIPENGEVESNSKDDDLNSKKKKELIVMADSLGLPVDERMTKQEMIDLIMESVN